MASKFISAGPPVNGEPDVLELKEAVQSLLLADDAAAARSAIGASDFSGSYDDLADVPAPVSPAWGGIGGTLASQSDLQTALDAKEDSGGLPIKDTVISAAQTIGPTQQCVTFGPVTVDAVVTVNGPWTMLSALKGI